MLPASVVTRLSTRHYKNCLIIIKAKAWLFLAILGFPCNQFGGQEPGSNKDVQHFCESNYGVTFDMFSKIDVKGEEQNPLYKYLTSQETSPTGSGDVKWNFEKFVIGRDGNVLARFGSGVGPGSDQFLKTVSSALKTKFE